LELTEIIKELQESLLDFLLDLLLI